MAFYQWNPELSGNNYSVWDNNEKKKETKKKQKKEEYIPVAAVVIRCSS